MTTSFSTSASSSTSASFIIFLSFASFLLPVILNMTKLFYIRKPITSANYTTIIKTVKDII